MNTGTKLRTILAIAISINTALAMTDITEFDNSTLNLIYKIISLVLNFVIVAINTYFNNDFTEEGCIGTGYTRQLKAENKEDYEGEKLFEEVDTDEVSENS